MQRDFFIGNRTRLYENIEDGALFLSFSGSEKRKTADENYPFFANRDFVYLTGITQKELVFLAQKDRTGIKETMFILPPDEHAERWNGARIKADEAAEISGISCYKYVSEFETVVKNLLDSGNYTSVYLDFDKHTLSEPDDEAYLEAAFLKKSFPFVKIGDAHPFLKRLRTIKQPCEIEAMKKAELITRDGILAMMRASKPGMYEYQYKAEFDYALAQHGVLTPMFPSIISAGKNNFCIHYYGYRGQAQDGDMILNDVGACWDNIGNDVSRGWPCNGKFSEKQKLLYNCAFNTSNHMFQTLKPGIPMAEVDLSARKYNFEQLKSIGLCKEYEEIGKYVWHGGAHHVGYDTHDAVDTQAIPLLVPGMVFCVDIGIYCEEWGIGFRLEDNCLITETGCENLSAVTPRSIKDIEDCIGK